MRRTKPRQVMVALAAEFLPAQMAARVITAECDRLDAAWKRGTLSVPVKALLPRAGGAARIRPWWPGFGPNGNQITATHRAAQACAEASIRAYHEAVAGLIDRG